MKLLDAILLSLSAGLFIIGVHQSMTVGIMESYFIFMLAVALLFVYKLKKRSR